MCKNMTLQQIIKNKDFEHEFDIIKVNNDIPITIEKSDYNVKEGIPQYTNSEKNGRSGSAVALLSKNTLAIYTSENIKYVEPKNWSEKIENFGIYNKCHIIAYSLSAKKQNRDNIFIGTEYLNKNSMKKFETKIYNEIKNGNRSYLYKVTPMYHKTDIVPFGVLMEVESCDKYEKKQYCRFCYNIQKGIKINYYDGGSDPIEKVYSTRQENIKRTRDTNKSNNKYREYAVNIKTKTFHLDENNDRCVYIQRIEPKYIQETMADKFGIINKGFKLCKKCTKELI